MAHVQVSEFWDMSPKECFIVIDGFMEFHSDRAQSEPLHRGELEALMELYPD